MAGILLLVIVAAAGIYYSYEHRKMRRRTEASRQSAYSPARGPAVFDSTPDLPVPFGYKCQWLAVATEDTQAVADTIGMDNMQVSNWKSGIEGAYDGYCFVSPPIGGWTLVVNPALPDLSGVEPPSPLNVIDRLSSRFGKACYFATHRVVEYHAWAKSVQGELVRAYGYVGESGETIINAGELSKEEREQGLIFTDLNADDPHSPNEEDVIRMAAQWTIDPMMTSSHYEKGTGFIGQSTI